MGRAKTEILSKVAHWDGITVHPHRFSGVEFRLGRREIGHLHGDILLDIPFPMSVKQRLVAEGKADRHHVLPDSGWVSFRIRSDDDIQQGVELLYQSFQLAVLSDAKKKEMNHTSRAKDPNA